MYSILPVLSIEIIALEREAILENDLRVFKLSEFMQVPYGQSYILNDSSCFFFSSISDKIVTDRLTGRPSHIEMREHIAGIKWRQNLKEAEIKSRQEEKEDRRHTGRKGTGRKETERKETNVGS